MIEESQLVVNPDVDYGFKIGDSVCHISDMDEQGIVTELDSEYDLGGVTTCRLVWGAASYEDAMDTPRMDQDIQWTNKLVRVEQRLALVETRESRLGHSTLSADRCCLHLSARKQCEHQWVADF